MYLQNQRCQCPRYRYRKAYHYAANKFLQNPQDPPHFTLSTMTSSELPSQMSKFCHWRVKFALEHGINGGEQPKLQGRERNPKVRIVP